LLKKTVVFVWTLMLLFGCAMPIKALADETPQPKAFSVITQGATVLDSDRAVLLGQIHTAKGYKVRQSGFYMGQSPYALSQKLKSNKLIDGQPNKLVTGLSPQTLYFYQAYAVTSKGTFKGAVRVFITPAQKVWTAQDAVFENTADRYTFLFGTDQRFYTTNSPPPGFATRAEASKHIVKVTVPIWRLSRGKKVASKMSVHINDKLENNVKAIFDEIYALDMQFPIYKLYGFGYRAIRGPGLGKSKILSHHSFGAAIDINRNHNAFYKNADNRNKKSPFCIPREVIDIFEKYGWAWGGDFKEGFDTMHFQYLGLDLTEK